MPTPFVIDPTDADFEFLKAAGYMPVLELPTLAFKRLTPDAILPTKGTTGAACYDLYSATEVVMAQHRLVVTVPTGIAVRIPEGHVGMVCSRSGLASKERMFVVNSPGIIDEDYRGEIKVILGMLPSELVWPSLAATTLPKGSRIAQLMVMPLPMLNVVEELGDFDTTERGSNGLGSTGV